MTKLWPLKYQDRVWIPPQPDGTKYDCWDLVREIEREEFGRSLPPIIPVNYGAHALIRELQRNEELKNWSKVPKPKEGDIVQLGHAKYPHHVGVWTEIDGGKVVHCLEGSGTHIQTIESLEVNSWGHFSFWTPRHGAY